MARELDYWSCGSGQQSNFSSTKVLGIEKQNFKTGSVISLLKGKYYVTYKEEVFRHIRRKLHRGELCFSYSDWMNFFFIYKILRIVTIPKINLQMFTISYESCWERIWLQILYKLILTNVFLVRTKYKIYNCSGCSVMLKQDIIYSYNSLNCR